MARSHKSAHHPGVKKALNHLIAFVAADPHALHLLAQAFNQPGRKAFINYVKQPIDDSNLCTKKEVYKTDWFSCFTGECKTKGTKIPECITVANNFRQGKYDLLQNAKKRFSQSLGFTARGRQANAARFAKIKRTTLTTYSRDEAYPPLGHWVFESSAIEQRWRTHLTSGRRADKRKPYLPMMQVDPACLEHDIGVEESGVFFNEKGKMVGFVCREFCPNEDVLAPVDNIIQEAVSTRRNARMEDPGSLVQIGFSAGSRSAPKFDWVKNITCRNLSSLAVHDMNYRASSAFALLWNLCLDTLPEEVLGDLDNFFEELNIARMNASEGAAKEFAGSEAPAVSGAYTIRIGEFEFTFKDAELAPPSGVVGQNYSRSMHFEYQPHKFAIAWTVRRDHPPEAGGHFYIGTYKMRIQAAPNTLVVWLPTDVHGTSLQDLDPTEENPQFLQTGLAIVTPNRLPSVWAKFRKGELTHQEMIRILAEDAEDHSQGEGGITAEVATE